ncbi:Echinoderm microtubule-associated protein-like 6, partial [Tetrabaena socialis]
VGTQAPPALRGLDCAPDNPEMFVQPRAVPPPVLAAGVASCDVWEVDKDPEVLVYGQQADLYGLAVNPAFPHVYATCCDSDKLTVWSAATRKPIRIVSLGGLVARGCAFSPDGQLLAVGCTNGGIKVLEFHPAVRQVWWGKTFSSSVDELKFSPCGRYLAAGSHEQ